MSKTLEQEIISYWKRAKNKDRKKLLQEYEAKNAREFERSEREIVVKKLKDENTHGLYNQSTPDIIIIADNKYINSSGLNAINVAYHEGLHATINDFQYLKHINFSQYGTLDCKDLFAMCEKDKMCYDYLVKNTEERSATFEETIAYSESTKNTVEHFLTLDKNSALEEFMHYHNLITNYINQRTIHKRVYSDEEIEKVNKKLGGILTFNIAVFKEAFPDAKFTTKENATLINNHMDYMEKNIIQMEGRSTKQEQVDDAVRINTRIVEDMIRIRQR